MECGAADASRGGADTEAIQGQHRNNVPEQCLMAGHQAAVKLFGQLRLLPQVGVFQEFQALFVAGMEPAVDFIQ